MAMTKKEKFENWIEEHSTGIIVGATLTGIAIITGVSVRNNCKYWKGATEAAKKISADYASGTNNVGAFKLGDLGEIGKKAASITGCELTTAVKRVDVYLDNVTT